jgi:hypothetical protein
MVEGMREPPKELRDLGRLNWSWGVSGEFFLLKHARERLRKEEGP